MDCAIKLTDELLDEPVAVLEEHGLSVRVINLLEEQLDIVYIRDAQKISRRMLLDGKGIGKKVLKEFQDAMVKYISSLSDG